MATKQSTTKAIRADAERLNTLLAGDAYYKVPPYQRDYRWEAEQTSKLFNDVTRSAKKGEGAYFLGAMVFVIEDEANRRYQVLDGQQRFASLLLLLRALQSVLEGRGAGTTTISQMVGMITPQDIYDNNNGDPFVHIQLNDEDRAFFNSTIKKRLASTSTISSGTAGTRSSSRRTPRTL